MNAINFIKQHGVEKARDVVERVPESGQPLYFNTVNSIYFFTGYRNRYFVNGVWGNEDDHPSMYEYDIKAVSIADLKRLIGSVELIKCFGDLEQAKSWLSDLEDNCPFVLKVDTCDNPFYKRELKQDIANYEAIYSGEEH